VIKNMNLKGTTPTLMGAVHTEVLDAICAKRVLNAQMDTTTVVLRLATGTYVFVVMSPLPKSD